MFQWLYFILLLLLVFFLTLYISTSCFFFLFLHSELLLLTLLSAYSVLVVIYADITLFGLLICFLILGGLELGLNLLIFTIS